MKFPIKWSINVSNCHEITLGNSVCPFFYFLTTLFETPKLLCISFRFFFFEKKVNIFSHVVDKYFMQRLLLPQSHYIMNQLKKEITRLTCLFRVFCSLIWLLARSLAHSLTYTHFDTLPHSNSLSHTYVQARKQSIVRMIHSFVMSILRYTHTLHSPTKHMPVCDKTVCEH